MASEKMKALIRELDEVGMMTYWTAINVIEMRQHHFNAKTSEEKAVYSIAYEYAVAVNNRAVENFVKLQQQCDQLIANGEEPPIDQW